LEVFAVMFVGLFSNVSVIYEMRGSGSGLLGEIERRLMGGG
jgi:hypothetical protein